MRLERVVQPSAIAHEFGARRSQPIDRIGSASLLEVIERGDYTLAGGSASGTVINDPLSPHAAFVSIDVTRSPENPGGPIRLDSTQVLLAHLLGFVLEGRAPPRTAAPTGAAATHEILSKFYFPLALFNVADGLIENTLTDLAKCGSAEVGVTWQASATALRDALYSSNDRTLTIPSADPLRAEIALTRAVLDADGGPPDAAMDIGLSLFSDAFQTGVNRAFPKNMQVGDIPLCALIVARDNAARDNALVKRIRGKLNGAEFLNDTAYEVQRRNAGDYGVRDGDWITGTYIVDWLAMAKGNMAKLKTVGSTGGIPEIHLDTESTAPTGTARFDIWFVFARPTSRGLALARKR